MRNRRLGICGWVAVCGLSVATLNAQMMGPMPDIRINGSDGPVTLTSSQNATVSVALYPEGQFGTQADWWCVVRTSFPAPMNWVRVALGGLVVPGIAPSYQGPLFMLDSTPLLNRTLPPGAYTFYFGVDTLKNGVLNMGQNVFFYDAVSVTVTPTVTEGDYLVIDLSAGPDALSYPVSYLTAVPVGGWTDEYKTTKLVLRRIPRGEFTMGSPGGELGRFNGTDETQHQVTLTKDFYMGVFEVTQKQWERVMGEWPGYFNSETFREARSVESVSYAMIRGASAGAGWPADSNVDADAFMGKLRSKTGLTTLDLPTEAQWEYACRAGTHTALNSGNDLSDTESCPNMSEVGRYYYNGGSVVMQGGDTSVGTATVGSYLPNAWGLYDMHGNVYEWCLDRYAAYPETVEDPLGPASGESRVFRGGSWSCSAWYCRSAFRYNSQLESRHFDMGFRLARTAP